MVTLHEDQYAFMITYRSVLLRMKNISDKCRENQNTHFIFKFFFFENHPFCEIMWKNTVEIGRQQTIDNMKHARFMLDSQDYRHTPKICGT